MDGPRTVQGTDERENTNKMDLKGMQYDRVN